MTAASSSSNAPDVVTTEVDARVLTVRIARPAARNALTRQVLAGLVAAFERAAADDAVRAVILAGEGGHFCAGADLRTTFAEDPEILQHLDAYMDAFHAVVKAIVRCPKPVVARVEGAAVGFGADLALACDLRVASEDAYLQEKFVHLGLMPDGGGTFWLPRLVGTARAMRAFLLGDKIPAPELEALGLLAAPLAAPGAPVAALARDLARRLADGPPLALAATKAAVWASWGDVEGALRRERDGQLKLLATSDVMEGVLAWTEKRPPNFQGR